MIPLVRRPVRTAFQFPRRAQRNVTVVLGKAPCGIGRDRETLGRRGEFRSPAGNPVVSDGDKLRRRLLRPAAVLTHKVMERRMAANETNQHAIPDPHFWGNRIMSSLCYYIEFVTMTFVWRAPNQTLDVQTT